MTVVKTVKINRNMDDLHLTDRLNRLRLRDWMRAQRDLQGLNDKQLADRVGHNSNWAHDVLSEDTWRVVTLQKMVRALGHRLVFNVDIDIIPVPLEVPTMASVYGDNPSMDRREEADRIDLCGLGGRLREARGLEPALLGRSLGQNGNQVRTFESGDKPGYLLLTAQRYFRALGGELKMVLVGPDGVPFEVPEGRWPEASDMTVRVTEGDGRVLLWNTHTPGSVVSFPEAAWRMFLETQRV